jgi:predicted RNA binding protein YcfA (HicA-like mRNA interferase family)
MTKLPQVSHERVVRALKRAGFYVLREVKHISMTDNLTLIHI